jgi:rubrerythrin
VAVQDLSGVESELSGGTGAALEGERADASRRRFLQLAAPVAAGGLAAFLSACGSSSDPATAEDKSSDAQSPKGGHDLEVVNFALTLEYIESDFYDKVVSAGIFSGDVGTLFALIQTNEREHVAALEALAKKIAAKKDTIAERPQTKFPLGGSPRSVLRLAATLENTGAAAYLGQAATLGNKEVLAAALSIHSVEARHAAKLNRLVGEEFTPDGAFAAPMEMEEVLDAVAPFIV